MHRETALCEDTPVSAGKKDQKSASLEAREAYTMLKTSRKEAVWVWTRSSSGQSSVQSLPGSLNTGPIQHSQEEPEQESGGASHLKPTISRGRSAHLPGWWQKKPESNIENEKFLFQGSPGELTTLPSKLASSIDQGHRQSSASTNSTITPHPSQLPQTPSHCEWSEILLSLNPYSSKAQPHPQHLYLHLFPFPQVQLQNLPCLETTWVFYDHRVSDRVCFHQKKCIPINSTLDASEALATEESLIWGLRHVS